MATYVHCMLTCFLKEENKKGLKNKKCFTLIGSLEGGKQFRGGISLNKNLLG